MVAGGDVGLGAGQFIEAGQQLSGDFAGVDLVFTDLQFGIGNDVGVGAGVAQRVLVITFDVIDQAFIQRPGVQLALPLIDHRVAEAEHLGLHVGNAGSQPSLTRGLQGFFAGVGEQRFDRFLKFHAGAVGVAEYSQRQIGIVADDSLGCLLVGALRLCGRHAFGRALRRGSLVRWRLVFAATGERDGHSEEAGGCPNGGA